MLCWVCRRDVTWDPPPNLTAVEREACDQCRPAVTNLRRALEESPKPADKSS